MIRPQIDGLYKKICPRRKVPDSINGIPLKKADMHVHTYFSKEYIPGGKNRQHGYAKITDLLLKILYAYRKAFYSRNFYGKPLKVPDLKNYELYFHLPYTPKQVFDSAIKSGMDFVPITDHDTIDGALDLIKRYPHLKKRVIVGEEVSAVLDKKYAMHIGVYGINARQHSEIQARKHDARQLVNYLKSQNILFALNHITGYIWGQIRPINIHEIKKCLELFDIMEVRNGIMEEHNNKVSEILASVCGKGMTAGTDSHSLRVGQTCTAAYARSKEEFLEKIMAKKSFALGGHGGKGIMSTELIDKFSNYKNLFLNGEKLFPGGGWFHDFVFDKIGKKTSDKLNDFIGTGIERENVKSVMRFLKKSGLL